MKIYLLRHGKTAGNQCGRYIGRTDEPLCEEGRRELIRRAPLPPVELLFVSPLLRCRQTAAIFYPDLPQIIVSDLRECDFGLFENKNHQELADCPQYQAWVDSCATLPFPQGESREEFQERCVRAFVDVLAQAGQERCREIACVVHGGTIMSIMERFARPQGEYFSYHVENGCGYVLHWPEEKERTDLAGEETTLQIWEKFTL